MRWVVPRIAIVLASSFVAACDGAESLKNALVNTEQLTTQHRPTSVVDSSETLLASALNQGPLFRGAEQRGSGDFVREPGPAYSSSRSSSGDEGITLNLVGAPISEAAKTVLGDVLKLNYTVSEEVKGTITLQTTTPVSIAGLTDAFEAALKTAGATIIRSGDVYRIVPLSAASQLGLPSSTRRVRGASPGIRTQIVSLRFVSASEMRRLIEPIAPSGAVVSADDRRNILVLSGTQRELEDIGNQIQLFDADWMKGMSVGLYPLKTSDPEAISKELDTIFGLDGKEAPLKGMVRFIPNQRLGSVLVIATKALYLDKAKYWLEKLDRAAQENDQQLFVYKIQNRSAQELAGILQRVLHDGADDPTASQDQPSNGATGNDVDGQGGAIPAEQEAIQDTTDGMQSGLNWKKATTPAPVVLPDAAQARETTIRVGRTKVVADASNNALLIQATPKEYERILRVLKRIDMLPTQVMLEAVIAEVTLSDELKFGLKWYFEKKNSSFTLSDALNGAVASSFPGFSYFFASKNVQVALDALSEVTKVNVVSAPSVMAMDNKKAVLQIGDQVPIITQTSQSVTNPDSPVINAVTMKDTGVILSVTPRVNDSGRVVLDIEQEVSSVTRTTSSDIDSPTIQQRRVRTTVVINDGEVLALGGLIQQRDEASKTQIPLLGNLPVVGTAFRQKSDIIDRTELVIFIRPSVVRDFVQASDVTNEFRARISDVTLQPTAGRRHYERDFDRIAR